LSNNNKNNNDEPRSTPKNSNIQDENGERKEMKDKEAAAQEFTSRKYLRSLSVNNKQKEEETIILLINGKQDYLVDISSIIQALQTLTSCLIYYSNSKKSWISGSFVSSRVSFYLPLQRFQTIKLCKQLI
jgi:hypothetical protein